MSFSKLNPLALFTLGIMALLTLPTLVQDGMFMDAMLYTSVSHNLAHGIGTFWFPEFPFHNSDDLLTFHEQPPLVFGIQAVFFKLFGDSMYVERFYVLVCLAFSTWLIARIHRLVAGPLYARVWWAPVLLWIIIPLVFWSFQNNMHENTMGVFVLLSIYFSIYAVQNGRVYSFGFLSGLCIAAAAMSKGVPGFFPLVAPAVYVLFIDRKAWRNAAATSLLAISALGLVGLLIYIIPDARESLSIYIHDRLFRRIEHAPIVDHHYYSAVRLASELIPTALLSLLIYLGFRNAGKPSNPHGKHALFFLALGICGTAPLMLTLVQRGFYMVPALPFFALSAGMMLLPQLQTLQTRVMAYSKWRWTATMVAIVTLFASLGLSAWRAGSIGRHLNELPDVYEVGQVIPKGTTVSIPTGLRAQWSLRTYLMRYYFIATDMDGKHEYYLCSDISGCAPPKDYEEIKTASTHLSVYKKTSP